MKKLFKTSFLLLGAMCLSSCSFSDSLVEKYIVERSGVLDDSEYISYLQNLENGRVEENGYWIIKDDVTDYDDGVEVSFVSNNHFDVDYYSDKELTQKLSDRNCHLQPGDSIYASTPRIKNIIETSYKFSEYQIYYFKGKEKEMLDTVKTDSGLVFTVPSDFDGDSISICPVGEFLPCNIEFEAYIKTGTKKTLVDAEWKVDNNSVINNNYSFVPNSDFTIDCNYPGDTGTYYLLESNILPSYYDDVEGVVRFDHVRAEKQQLKYSVVIKEYTTITFNNKKDVLSGIKAQVKYGGEVAELDKGSTDLGKFKAGEELQFTLEKGYTIGVNGLFISSVIETQDGNIITVKVTENSPAQANIKIEKKTTDKAQTNNYIENGIITVFHTDGTLIEDDESIELSENINVVITPNTGYYITGNKVIDNVYSESMKFVDFKKKCDDIIKKHEIKKYIVITLEDSDEFGECRYYLNKKLINGTVDNLKENDIIKMSYTLTDANYTIDQLIPSITASKNIKISTDLNNAIIRRENYISIKKKG